MEYKTIPFPLGMRGGYCEFEDKWNKGIKDFVPMGEISIP